MIFCNAFARAHVWKEALIAGSFTCIADIARHESVTERYVTKILDLAFLTPAVVELMLAGRNDMMINLQEFPRRSPIRGSNSVVGVWISVSRAIPLKPARAPERQLPNIAL